MIVEPFFAYRDQTKKTLLWELIEDQPRFKKFELKIVQFILDDADLSSNLPETTNFGCERIEEQYLLFQLKNGYISKL